MGRASNRKKHRRAERDAEAGSFQVVVCTYPDMSLEPALELLKAAVVYGDKVLLHSPTAILLASVASISSLPAAELLDFVRQIAPSPGDQGATLEAQMQSLDDS